ncbi:16S rRNA (guanine(966)-N(2))-methyltransferase RsmD [uncultured Desulfobacter sp.]|uniref:16S rRNA (guanine(966)-N(2))-methyltransferase RsmD n=1 Tax=uncultured Desulfobacter sp. TaxID=240139 RepID=UPI002AAC3C83|nr:16S rRNA (guanine(966)-N(2))-methyltransferase RsmD [uncultured Desulfobacter sp.]
MRIISGACRGRKLVQIQGKDIRPTSDRVREALFNILGPGIREKRVLDMFAGTGAFGLEALSRGAQSAVFVDEARSSCNVIKQNIELCRMADQAQIICHDLVNAALPEFQQPFDLIFMDPPYNKGYPGQVMGKHGFSELLAPGATLIVEQSVKETLNNTLISLDKYLEKKYSRTTLTFWRKSATDDKDIYDCP